MPPAAQRPRHPPVRRIVPNRAESCRIVPNRASSSGIVPIRADPCRIVPKRTRLNPLNLLSFKGLRLATPSGGDFSMVPNRPAAAVVAAAPAETAAISRGACDFARGRWVGRDALMLLSKIATAGNARQASPALASLPCSSWPAAGTLSLRANCSRARLGSAAHTSSFHPYARRCRLRAQRCNLGVAPSCQLWAVEEERGPGLFGLPPGYPVGSARAKAYPTRAGRCPACGLCDDVCQPRVGTTGWACRPLPGGRGLRS